MSEEPEKKEIEVIDPKLVKKFEEIAEKTFQIIMKKDYRATVVHREEKGGIDDSEAALIHVNEEAVDETGHPLELDVKGTITGGEAWLFTEIRYGGELMGLKKWRYSERKVINKDGTVSVEREPVNLATRYMMAKERTNMAKGGSQSTKHIRERQANAGRNIEDDISSKAAGWMGMKRERRDKDELREQYGEGEKR